MTLNIVITSRNKPKNITRLLNSLSNIEHPINKAIIIDDSTEEKNNEAIIDITNSFDNLNPYVINKKTIEKIYANSGLFKNLKLGTANWNLANGRNIGMLFSYSSSEGIGQTMFLDDDMIFREKIKSELFNSNSILKQITIEGCPDLSRLEWIEFYIKTRNPIKKSLSDYVEKIYNSINKKYINSFLSYTELYYSKHRKIISLPNRNELSGGAFIVSTSIFKSCSFPSWFDEDWFWFDKIRTIASTNQDNTNIKILHNSDKKVILDLDCLKFEEDGKILTNSLKNGNKAIQESVNKQIDFVLYKLNYIQETLWNIKSKNGTDERIQYHLKQLYEYIKNKNASYYISEIDKFNYFNNNWITEFDKTVELLKNNR